MNSPISGSWLLQRFDVMQAYPVPWHHSDGRTEVSSSGCPDCPAVLQRCHKHKSVSTVPPGKFGLVHCGCHSDCFFFSFCESCSCGSLDLNQEMHPVRRKGRSQFTPSTSYLWRAKTRHTLCMTASHGVSHPWTSLSDLQPQNNSNRIPCVSIGHGLQTPAGWTWNNCINCGSNPTSLLSFSDRFPWSTSSWHHRLRIGLAFW